MDNFCSSIIVTKSLGNLMDFASCLILKSVLPLLTTLAVASFIWGIIQFFLNPYNEKKREDGKGYMIWGLVSLFVMVSIWGIVNIFSETFGIETFIPQLSQ